MFGIPPQVAGKLIYAGELWWSGWFCLVFLYLFAEGDGNRDGVRVLSRHINPKRRSAFCRRMRRRRELDGYCSAKPIRTVIDELELAVLPIRRLRLARRLLQQFADIV